ncbi:MAG TPA: InlB B-repeat-containing protein, partial [Oscillospiraceae bacterium]|nr:InlB B-repeat-containing protein [Oscillospiraceae bacterium]
MKLFKNLAALCLAALMVLGVGGSFLPDALDAVVTAKASTHYLTIWYKVGDGPDDDDLETEIKYYDEDDVDDGVDILEPDDVWDEDDYDGWTFRYWESNIDVDGDGDDEDKVYPGDTIDDADEGDVLKLTAVWREDDDDDGDYEITYKIGEAGDADDVVKYTDGDFTAPKVSKIFDSDDYDGWDFDCWKITKGDSDYKGEYYDAGDTIDEEAFNDDDEITLTAQWDENDDVCTVKFSSGNSSATGTNPTTKSVDYGDTITLPSNPYTLSGYTFAGWDVDGTVKKAGDTITVKDDLTIKATWTAVANVTLTYSPGKGTGTSYTKTYTAGTTIKLEANSFTRDGYTFAGWWIASV